MNKLVIDFDDVICDNQFLQAYNEFFHTSKKHSDFPNFYVDSVIEDMDTKIAFGKYVIERNFYDGAIIKKGAPEAIKKLSQKYNIYICTAYYMDYVRDLCGNILKQKYEFIAKYLPFYDMSKIIFTNSKSTVNADIMIDDNMRNLLTNNACKKLLYTAEHNEKLTDDELRKYNIVRVKDWDEILKVLMEEGK